jgi:hypothetical protein
MSETATHGTTARRRLPHRRVHELIDFEHEGRRYTAGIGRFEDGRVDEIFVNVSGRAGGMAKALARDTAVAASLCLQFGCENSQGRASGPVGELLDLLRRQ